MPLSLIHISYGSRIGFTVPSVDLILEPYAEKSYNRALAKYERLGIAADVAEAEALADVQKEFEQGFQGLSLIHISCISNLAAGMTDQPLNHEEVQEAADMAAPRFKKLVTESVKKFV